MEHSCAPLPPRPRACTTHRQQVTATVNDTTARDLMLRLEDYPHARQSQTLADAAALLSNAEIEFHGKTSIPRALLVLDDEGHLVGSIRRRDILRGIAPALHDALGEAHPEAHVEADIDPNLADLIPAQEPAQLAAKLDRPIADVVHELRARVGIDDSLMKIVRELVGQDTHIAAVLENDNVVGVVRSSDVLRALLSSLD